MNDHLSERELVRMAIATLHRLARACHDRFRSKRSRGMIREIEYRHHRALELFEDSKRLVEPSARLAWLELDEDCRDLISTRGGNPDSLLEWLDLYPRIVQNTILGPLSPEKSVEPAKTH